MGVPFVLSEHVELLPFSLVKAVECRHCRAHRGPNNSGPLRQMHPARPGQIQATLCTVCSDLSCCIIEFSTRATRRPAVILKIFVMASDQKMERVDTIMESQKKKPAPCSLDSVLTNRLRMKDLALICAVDSCRHLHRAAEQIHISQPSATKMLQEIEHTFGMPLFERQPRGMTPHGLGSGSGDLCHANPSPR